MLFRPSGKGQKRQKKGEKGRFRPISRKGGQTPLKPPFVTPPFAAAQRRGRVQWGRSAWGPCTSIWAANAHLWYQEQAPSCLVGAGWDDQNGSFVVEALAAI